MKSVCKPATAKRFCIRKLNTCQVIITNIIMIVIPVSQMVNNCNLQIRDLCFYFRCNFRNRCKEGVIRILTLSIFDHFAWNTQHDTRIGIIVMDFANQCFIAVLVFIYCNCTIRSRTCCVDRVFSVQCAVICTKHNNRNIRFVACQSCFNLVQSGRNRSIGNSGIDDNIIFSSDFIQIFCKKLWNIVISSCYNTMCNTVSHKEIRLRLI